jgi:transposase
MLLFLLHDKFRDRPERRPPATPVFGQFREDARALFGAGLFLSLWCVLRLFAARGHGLNVDVVLALLCLYVGVAAVLRSVLDLRFNRRRRAKGCAR